MLSSKGDGKSEARYAARLDVLMERVDTLAATVATTASSMARKDGEIANLQRELEERDQTLQQLAAQMQAGIPLRVDDAELQSLREAVARLSAPGTGETGSQHLDEFAAKTDALGQRLDALSSTVSTTIAGLAERGGDLESLRAQLEQREGEPHPPSDELRVMLATLRAQVESLDALQAGGVTEEQLEERFSETEGDISRLSRRLEGVSEKLERALSGLEQKEQQLTSLHENFVESSARVETIVADLRDALATLPAAGPEVFASLDLRLDSTDATLASLARRVERVETTDDDELAERLELVDRRLSAVTEEIGRAKTLWPVALRSLEARVDDVAERQEAHARLAETAAAGGDDSDDLLAGLRDSLQAMESVAAGLGRPSPAEDRSDPEHADEADLEQFDEDPPEIQEAVGGGARIVPLRHDS